MASARPQLTPATAAKQPRASKKRKTRNDAPAAFRASAAARDACGTLTHCSLCGFGASTLDHLLTHVRESHSHGQASPQMALPLQVAQMVVQRALDQAALGGATSAWLEAMQQQYGAASEMMAALERRDAHSVAATIHKLHSLLQVGDEQTLVTTLQEAAKILLQSPDPTADATPVPHVAIKQETQAQDQTVTDAAVPQQQGKDSSIHEAEAAQALTGLRATASTAATTQTNTAPTSSARPPAVPKPIPSAPQASFPSFALGSPLTITAPQPQLGSPHFHPPELFTPGTARSPSTPSSLPSLFARRLLAPLASPSSVTDPGDRLAQAVAGLGYQNPMIVTDQRNTMVSTIRPDTSPASLTPVYYPSFPTLSAANNGVPTATPTNRPTSASPVKRKSITSKQLSVRCDAEVAAARAAASTAAAADTSGVLPLGPISVPGTPGTPATRKATPRRWTKDEDDALRAAVENHREKNWKAIAAQVPGRNHTQCLQRWTKVLAPGLVKGHWSPHEDELLRRLVATEQKNWGDVASKIPGRTSKQCRERWHNHLDPQIVRGAYTPEEDRLILEAQARLGNRWSVIAAMLPGRTEDAVKIRWKSHCRVWRARKYLRKNPNSDVDMMSEPAQTPRTPLVPPTGDFKWPVSLPIGASDEQTSNTSKTNVEQVVGE
ncbi:Transcription factor MYB3R-5 [Phytophthora citrophthora]|uniref:Transcription factor MYB3R-5 n=1 Tax=Phytophthora citrophthora TaxID=4793 RepID=A0AAD9G4L5_9STRA|nr:Transcription factor MYB3R-5 [Phytophthora citrophthora]